MGMYVLDYTYENEMKRIEEIAKTKDVGELMESYDHFFTTYSFRPNKEQFPYPKEGEVIDEDKSVKWNAEEVRRLRDAFVRERTRLSKQYGLINDVYHRHLKDIMGNECGLSNAEASIVWGKAWEDGHSNGIYDVYSRFCDLAEMVEQLRDAWESSLQSELQGKAAEQNLSEESIER